MTMNLSDRLISPQWFAKGTNGYIMGTDALGQDLLTRLFVGGRTSFLIALFAVLGGSVLGTFMGMLAGYYGKKWDTLIMRIGDVQLSINTTLLAIVIASILGASVANLIIIMIISTWVKFARVLRGEVMMIKNKEFIHASRVLGASNFHIMFRQVLPNVTTPLIVLISQQFGQIILLEAALSFLGMGVPMPQPSWGTMISEGRQYLSTAPWIVVAPGIALMTTVVAFNFLGDGIRDVLDPKMKH
jgi:peptide/nickel transport system permease protein